MKEKIRIRDIVLSQAIDRLQYQELHISGNCKVIINGEVCEAIFSCLWNDSTRIKSYCPVDYRVVALTKYSSKIAAMFAISEIPQTEIEKEIKNQLPRRLREVLYDTGFLSKVYAKVKKDRCWQLTPSREEFLKETTPPQIRLKYKEKYKGLNIAVIMGEFEGRMKPRVRVYEATSELPLSHCYWQVSKCVSALKAAKEAIKFIQTNHLIRDKEPPRQQTMSLENRC